MGGEHHPFFVGVDTGCDCRLCLPHPRHAAYADDGLLPGENLADKIHQNSQFLTDETESIGVLRILLDDFSVLEIDSVDEIRLAKSSELYIGSPQQSIFSATMRADRCRSATGRAYGWQYR